MRGAGVGRRRWLAHEKQKPLWAQASSDADVARLQGTLRAGIRRCIGEEACRAVFAHDDAVRNRRRATREVENGQLRLKPRLMPARVRADLVARGAPKRERSGCPSPCPKTVIAK
jgi:hypothetical protein